ncbi:hypothetical protein BD779DRAFT_1498084 [Infundibulicybe gibba]|nr:hypothetical protein BD779DRAFT_1593255 [Infundibulicybe gibba]KAF8895199.1 hypothetical protein BD779DRAFT_1498084 [Infundibulicybe gibba]
MFAHTTTIALFAMIPLLAAATAVPRTNPDDTRQLVQRKQLAVLRFHSGSDDILRHRLRSLLMPACSPLTRTRHRPRFLVSWTSLSTPSLAKSESHARRLPSLVLLETHGEQ